MQELVIVPSRLYLVNNIMLYQWLLYITNRTSHHHIIIIISTACTQQACIKCCTDANCIGHREQRAKEHEKQLILQQSHPLQLQAQKLRANLINSYNGSSSGSTNNDEDNDNTKNRPQTQTQTVTKLFKEDAFRYLGETLLIWDVRTYMNLKNGKYREDAVRKSRRYVESAMYQSLIVGGGGRRKQFDLERPPLEGRKRRFQRVMDYLYQQSLK